MAKYKCKVCGYVHEGNKAPDTCPVCSAPASEFEEIKEEGAAKKGINRDSNVYTVVYAAVMVVLVAVVLAFTSQSLRSFQKQNEDNDKRQQILRSINVNVSSSEAETKYNELIKEAFLVNENGEKVEGDAFATDVVKAATEHQYPVFVANVDGQPKYIMALHGAGLWGPLWGYISVDSDKNTIYGADFSHQGETPGLGAEISKPAFSNEFKGKKIFMSGEFKSVAVVKPGKSVAGQDYVDGISGGTITSKGVLSEKNKEVLLGPLSANNPVVVQMLGICSALAVTSKLEPAIVMGISVTAVVAFANVIISLMRNTIPNRIRIIVQLVVVAALVTIVSEVLKAFAYDVNKQLSVFVGLIITNCILMGRLEAFALGNGPWESFLDGIGNGLGYAIILIIVGFFRELLGSGTLLGFQVIPQAFYDLGYVNNGLMILPPMALIVIAVIIWVHRAKNKELQEN